jgi:restriction system protein
MGAMHFRRIELVSSLSEHVGYKAGLALTRERIAEMLDRTEDGLILGGDDAMLRIRSEEYGDYLCKLLYGVGNISSPDSMPSVFTLYRKFEKNKRLFRVYLAVQELFTSFCEESYNTTEDPIDLNKFVAHAKSQYEIEGEYIALMIADCLVADMHKSFIGGMRRIAWKDITDLESLFKSENLKTVHGEFLDQRYVDFLTHNFKAIDKINWRKFEGLTCEFFHRVGLHVEIGKGRDDDSVDARIWQKGSAKNKPPLILVQCKREKQAIGKVVVKALYADVKHEDAKSDWSSPPMPSRLVRERFAWLAAFR